MITIYHNPRCQKSRTALQYLESLGEEITIVEYLKTPPSASQLASVIKMLGKSPEDVVRKKEELYISKYAGKKHTNKQWIEILSKHPILIERPIIIKDSIAIIGRDDDSLRKIY